MKLNIEQISSKPFTHADLQIGEVFLWWNELYVKTTASNSGCNTRRVADGFDFRLSTDEGVIRVDIVEITVRRK